MIDMDKLGRLRAVIEDELGEFVPLANLPARDIEAMAERLTRAIAQHLDVGQRESRAA